MHSAKLTYVLCFASGACIGVAVGILFAPVPGAETRLALGSKAEQARLHMAQSGRAYYDRGRDLYDRGRHLADEAGKLFEEGQRLMEGNSA